MASPQYVFDTNVLINLQRRHPMDIFPSLWTKISALMKDGTIISSKEVFDEIATGQDSLVAWSKEHSDSFIPSDEKIQREVRDILKEDRGLVEGGKKANSADPFVIALAHQRQCTVVSEETRSGNPKVPKIPDICDKYGVVQVDFVGFMRENKILV